MKKIFTWKNILRVAGIGLGVALVASGASFIGLIPGVSTAVAQAVAVGTGIVGTAAVVTTGVGAVAAAAKGAWNGIKAIFNIGGYRDQLKQRRAQRQQRREQRREQRRQRRAQRQQRREQNRKRGNTVNDITLTDNDDLVVDVDEDKNNDNIDDVINDDNNNDNKDNDNKDNDNKDNDNVDDVIDNDNNDNNNNNDNNDNNNNDNNNNDDTVIIVEPPVQDPVKKKPSKKAGGLYDSLSEDNKLLYDTIASKSFTNVFAKLSHDQFDEFQKILKNDVEQIKQKDPSTLTRSDIQTLALVDKMLRARHHKVQSEGKKRYAPTKKESKKLTEEEIKAKSDELALDALIDKTNVSEEDIEKQKNKNKTSKGR